ncbi:MAG TPA: hypothetical protein VK590_08505 [Saprospiraceae bacterium]|nr:hypothetical protein [Saprospiraceae bacterium]
MTTIRFNPLTYSRKLMDAGMKEDWAEVIAQEQADIVSNILNNEMVTKNDFIDVKRDIFSLKHEFKQVENRLTIKLGSIMLVGIGILGFILKH